MSIDKFERRKERVRFSLKRRGKGKLRLSVFRSQKYIYAQIIDDTKGHTLAAARSGATVEDAKKAGDEIARKALSLSISQVVFDKGGYTYHGRIAALADAARTAGLQF